MKFAFFLTVMALIPGLIQAQVQDSSSASYVGEDWPAETFRAVYLINSQSVETAFQRELLFTVSHRFGGAIDEGITEFFGVDLPSNIRFGVVYGFSDYLNIGIGRSRIDKIYDGFFKWKIIDGGRAPIGLTLLGSAAVSTREWTVLEKENLEFRHRMSYFAQAMLGSRLTPWLSVQIMPGLIHRNLALETNDGNTAFTLGAAATWKWSKKVSLTLEYTHPFQEQDLGNRLRRDVVGFGIDIVRGLHVFQLQMTNNVGIVEQDYFNTTTDDFFEGKWHIGFQIIRKFLL